MKKLLTAVSLCLVLIFTLSLVGCSSYGKLQKAFEDAGYELVTGTESESAKADYEDADHPVTFYLYKNKTYKTVKVAILEFKSTDEIEEYLEGNNTALGMIQDILENEDVQATYAKLEEAGIVKGNCLVLPTSLSSLASWAGISQIVKNA